MFLNGLEEEVRRILASGVAPSAHALKAIGYSQVVEMLAGSCDRETAIEHTKQASRKLAKRQLTWLRSSFDASVTWVEPVERGGVAAVIAGWDHHIGESNEP